MIPVLSVQNMRVSDAETIRQSVSGRELMLRAARGIVRETQNAFPDLCGPIAIVCGSGNNAGDGYAAALLLKEQGLSCELILLSEKFSPDALYYYTQCQEKGIKICPPADTAPALARLREGCYPLILDCIFGTGFHGVPDGSAAEAIAAINDARLQYHCRIVSADINSGLNGDNGLGVCAVRSDLTVAVGSYKPGLFLNQAKDLIDRRVFCDIGIAPVEQPFMLLEPRDVAALFPKRQNDSHKGTYGYIALMGGSLPYSGAIRLANLAASAMRCGAGVVKIAAPASLCGALMPLILESTLFPLEDNGAGAVLFSPSRLEELIRGTRAIAFGMGIGTSEETSKTLRYLLEHYNGTLIIDADGLNALAGLLQKPDSGKHLLRHSAARIILTPHLKEFSRLCGASVAEIREHPVELARDFAGSHQVTVLLKGPSTLITDGSRVYLTDRGCPGMGTAGSGDVLSGILAAVCGQHPDSENPALLAAAGAFINGAAGELAQEKSNAVTMTAGDTARSVQEIMIRLLKE